MTNKELQELLKKYDDHLEIVIGLDFNPPKGVELVAYPDKQELVLLTPFKGVRGVGQFTYRVKKDDDGSLQIVGEDSMTTLERKRVAAMLEQWNKEHVYKKQTKHIKDIAEL